MQNAFLKFTGLSCLAVLLMFSSCKPDDDDANPTVTPEVPVTPKLGKIDCKINGKSFSAAYPFTSGAIANTSPFYSIAVGGFDFIDGDSVGVALAMTGTDFSSLANGDVFQGSTALPGMYALGSVSFNSGAKEEDADSEETLIATITVTKIDRDNNVISGTFSYEAKDPDTESEFTVTEGVFTDIKYD